MEIIKIISVAIITCFLALLLKQYKPEFAMAAAICGGVLMLMMAAPSLMSLIDRANQFAARAGIDDKYLAPAFKIVGIAYLTQYSSEMCRDAGEGALAAKLEMTGKIIMLTVALPVAAALFETIEGILP